jgi:predicted ester cyclase
VSGGESSRREDRMGEKSSNLKILAEYTERIKNGDTDAVYDYFAPGFVSHVTRRVAPESSGLDVRLGEVMFWRESANAFPDREFVVEKLWEIESEEVVIVNWTMTGTHTGASYFGVPPSGRRVEINGTGIVRFENGRIVEHWGGPHCMHGIGLLAGAETPTKISPEQFAADAKAAAQR